MYSALFPIRPGPPLGVKATVYERERSHLKRTHNPESGWSQVETYMSSPGFTENSCSMS